MKYLLVIDLMASFISLNVVAASMDVALIANPMSMTANSRGSESFKEVVIIIIIQTDVGCVRHRIFHYSNVKLTGLEISNILIIIYIYYLVLLQSKKKQKPIVDPVI